MEILENPMLSYNILYNLSPSNIRDTVNINNNLISAYNDDYFWAQYCKLNYFVTMNNNHSWIDIAFMAEHLLVEVMFESNLFPSFVFIQILILNIDDLVDFVQYISSTDFDEFLLHNHDDKNNRYISC